MAEEGNPQTQEDLNQIVERLEDTLPSPSVYINKFYVTTGDIIHINFGEEIITGGKLYSRVSIILTAQNAMELSRLIYALLKTTEDEYLEISKKMEEARKRQEGNG